MSEYGRYFITQEGNVLTIDDLYHHGVKGQKWGIRRYQNRDGTLTEAGRKRYTQDDINNIKTEIKTRRARAVERGKSAATNALLGIAELGASAGMLIGAGMINPALVALSAISTVSAGITGVGAAVDGIKAARLNSELKKASA